MDILRPMIHLKLAQVCFWRTKYDDEDEEAYADRIAVQDAFERDLRAEKHQRAIRQHIKCAECNTPVVDTVRQVVHGLRGLPSTQCIECDKHYCRSSSCPADVQGCKNCQYAFCNSCSHVLVRCGVCNGYFCEDCTPVNSCRACFIEKCEECSPAGFCGDCYDALCKECAEEQGLRVNSCNKCKSWYCGDLECRTVNFCEGCLRDFCEDCSDMTTCDHCDETLCDECIQIPTCDCCLQHHKSAKPCKSCDGSFCDFCGNGSCSSCKFTLCNNCPLPRNGRFTELLPLWCKVCGQYESTPFCASCKKDHVSPSLGLPSIYLGTRSTCIDDKPPAKRQRLV